MILQEGWDSLDYPLDKRVKAALHSHKFPHMMPVQKAAIPLMLKNYDLAVEAQTGSGKTLAFVIPLIQRILKLNLTSKKLHTPIFLLLAPTRELSHQTYSLFVSMLEKIDKEMIKYSLCATGGRSVAQDLKSCDAQEFGVAALFGTVGRVKEILGHKGKTWFNKVDYLYIDQGDRVLQEKGIAEVVGALPKMRRTAIFSATLQGITQTDLKLYGMRNLAKISLKATATQKKQKSKQQQTSASAKDSAYTVPLSLNNQYLICQNRTEKILFLINFIHSQIKQPTKTIVFLNTCASVEFYTKILTQLKAIKSAANNIYGIHGQMKPKKRNKIISDFMGSEKGFLFATDVVARGIDFENVNYILQIDPPDDPDNYIHRIGRTARVNRQGHAILFLEEHESAFIQFLKNKNVSLDLHAPAKPSLSDETVIEQLKSLMLTDRDLIEKSKRAFVSFVRSYKQHDLKYIFEFKNLDIGGVANSFLLLRLPRIKQILGRHIQGFKQSEVDIESIHWKDKNQERQFNEKREHTLQAKQEMEKLMPKSKSKDIKNSKSLRKKMKRKMQYQVEEGFRNEERSIRKERNAKTLLTKVQKRQREQERQQDLNDLSADTEELEQRINNHVQNKKLKTKSFNP